MVKLEQACDPDGECDVRDLFVGSEDKKCMELHATVSKPRAVRWLEAVG
jgi:hypothetical protein